MTELTTSQMADMEGRFMLGFLCGVGIIASIAITPTTSVWGRRQIYLRTFGACGAALWR